MNKTLDQSDRILWIDQSKGFAIILMIFGHCWSRTFGMSCWISSFHMPIFFVIAGYFMAQKDICFNSEMLFKKMKRLLIPYYVFSFAILTMISVLQAVGGYDIYENFVNGIKEILCFDAGMPTWFLPCLFFAECIFTLFLKLSKNIKARHILFLILCILGSFYINIESVFVIVIRRSLLGAIWLDLGYIIYDRFQKDYKNSLLLIIGTFIIHMILSIYNGEVGVITLSYGKSRIVFIIAGFLGSVAIIGLLKKIQIRSKILEFCGKYSLEFLCTHVFVIEILRLMDYKIFNGFIGSLYYLEGYVLTIIVIIIDTFLILFLNKYVPFLFGKTMKSS